MVADAISAGIAVNALSRVARQVGLVASEKRAASKSASEERTLARLFEAFDFDSSLLRLRVDIPSGVKREDITAVVESPRGEAIAFELLMLELTGSTPQSIVRLRQDWLSHFDQALPGQAALGGDLFDALRAHYEIAVSVAREQAPSALQQLEDAAKFERIACVLESLDARLSGSGETFTSEAATTFIREYRARLRQSHRNIVPPDLDRRRDVPIEDLYVGPKFSRTILDEEVSLDVNDLLEEIDRTVLLGDPGNGKSTFGQVLLYRSANQPRKPLPFLVVLRDFAADGATSMSIVEFIESRLNSFYQCPAPTGLVKHLLQTGQGSVVFDGLDELLDTSDRREVTDVVGNFCNQYPLAKVLVTSRQVGYEQAPMDRKQFTVFKLSGFDREQVREYTRRWFRQEEISDEEAQRWTEAFMEESEAVEDLTKTPLLLALMCIIYRGERSLPRNRPDVYHRCASMLFDKWDSSRKINVELRAGPLVDAAMKHLALWLLTESKTDGVTEEALVKETAKYLLDRSFEKQEDAESAAREFIEFCRNRAWVFSDAGTLPDGRALYKFTHKTFLEYFAAYHLFRTTDTPEALVRKILPRIARAEWDVVGQLAVQICDKQNDMGAIRIFQAFLGDGRRRAIAGRANILAFLARCTSFVQLSPSILRQMVGRCVEVACGDLGKSDVAFQELDPLTTLLQSARFSDPDVIVDELWRQLATRIESDGDGTAMMAMSLVTHSRIFASGPLVTSGSSEGDHSSWEERFASFAEDHKDAFLKHVGSDLEISRFVVENGWITLAEFIEAFQDDLNPLFAPVPCRALGVNFTNQAHSALDWGLHAGPEGAALKAPAKERFVEELGALVGTMDAPLLNHKGTSYLFPFHQRGTRTVPSDLSPDALAGLAFLVAVALEDGMSFPDVEWGPMAPLVALMARRAHIEGVEPASSEEVDKTDAVWLREWSLNRLNIRA